MEPNSDERHERLSNLNSSASTVRISSPASRPITALGATVFELEETQKQKSKTSKGHSISAPNSSHSNTRPLFNSTSTAVPSMTTTTTTTTIAAANSSEEFDIRSFLLDQKNTNVPFHKSSLFRMSKFMEEQQEEHQIIPLEQSKLPATRAVTTSQGMRKRLPKKMEPIASSSFSSSVTSPGRMGLNGSSSVPILPSPSSNSLDFGPAVDDGLVHFYTMERMAESCFHAVQSKNKTWQLLPGAEERSKGNNHHHHSSTGNSTGSGGISSSSTMTAHVERPSKRSDLLDLTKCFDTALQFVKHKNPWEVVANEKLALIDRDYMSIHTRVSSKFPSLQQECQSQDQCPTPSPSLTASGGCPTRAGSGTGSGTSTVNTTTSRLAKLFFEQKWSDIVLGELESMLVTSFLEQGTLLRQCRLVYAQSFHQLEQLYTQKCQEVMHLQKSKLDLQQKLTQKEELFTQQWTNIQKEQDKKIHELILQKQKQKEENEKKVQDAQLQVSKMSESMRTLNTIFRQMREDTEKVKAMELKEQNAKLETKCDHFKEEIDKLKIFVIQNGKLLKEKDVLTQEMQQLKTHIQQLEEIVQSKQKALEELLANQSAFIAKEERQLAEKKKNKKNKHQKEEEEEEEVVDEFNRRLLKKAAGPRVLCHRCRLPTTTGSTTSITSITGGDNSSTCTTSTISLIPKVQCLYFRILLPNLRGRRPQRERIWTFSIMRSILFAKQLEDGIFKRIGGNYSGLIPRLRFPEFVYGWFSPWKSLKETTDTTLLYEGQVVSTTNATAADEDRWCFYYGLKTLVQEGFLEAKLFFSLLDEKYGEEEQVFLLYCYRVVDSLMAGRLEWGPLRNFVSYTKFQQAYEQKYQTQPTTSLHGKPPKDPTSTTSTTTTTHTGPYTIWISLYHAQLATSVVLSKATEEEKQEIDKKLTQLSVNNIPDHEKPTFCLFPPTSTSTSTTSSTLEQQQQVEAYIDAHVWIELMMMEYKEEQIHRRAAVRLMFQTANSTMSSTSSSSSTSDTTSESTSESTSEIMVDDTISTTSTTSTQLNVTMDMEQFRHMVRCFNEEMSISMVASLYRQAYMKGNGAVTYDSFMEIAEQNQFFSNCMRLESPADCLSKITQGLKKDSPTFVALSTSSKAAFLVDHYFTILQNEFTEEIESLPNSICQMTDSIKNEITSCLVTQPSNSTTSTTHGSFSSSGSTTRPSTTGTFADGVRLLTCFTKLIENLLLVKLVKREVTGGLLSSKNIFHFEKAMASLVDCVRVKDKSTVEVLIDTVRHKLCVKKVQSVFRQHLHRDEGAPLAMRYLLHRDYGSGRTKYRTRIAKRPLKWLSSVVIDLFRTSLENFKTNAGLLFQLTGISNVTMPIGVEGITWLTSHLNHGIGVTSRPLLMEWIYDYFMDKFGTRWEAEKLVHDVFVNCRSHVQVNQRILLFSLLCSMGGSGSNTSSANTSDRLLGSNEALAFILTLICQRDLHEFRCFYYSSSHDQKYGFHTIEEPGASGGEEQNDLVSLEMAHVILTKAFDKLAADHKQKMFTRMEEIILGPTAAGILIVRGASYTPPIAISPLRRSRPPSAATTTGTSSRPPSVTSSRPPSAGVNSFTSAERKGGAIEEGGEEMSSTLSNSYVDADTFLVFCLYEWKRYIQHRMNEIRVICCELEEEMYLFEDILPLDIIALILQKANIEANEQDVCIVYRRFCAMKKNSGTTAIPKPPIISNARPTSANIHPSSTSRDETSGHSCPAIVVVDHLSDRLAAAAYPLIAREPTLGFHRPADALPTTSTKQRPSLHLRHSFELLVSSWLPYETCCRSLNEDLKRIAKNNEIQLQTTTRKVTSTTSKPVAPVLNTKDLDILEQTLVHFLEKLERLHQLFSCSEVAITTAAGEEEEKKMTSIHVLLQETWKLFRTLIIEMSKGRAFAGIGMGPLPDQWTT